jgi:hypothetical protein
MDRFNQSERSIPEFWRTDSAEVFQTILERGKQFLAQHGIIAESCRQLIGSTAAMDQIEPSKQ